jgi:ligand-binding SRPBCC domain-containing protein
MKIYTLTKTQFLPISIQEAWEFFSSPRNLSKITPGHMGFKILYLSGSEKMYNGQIIRYKVNVLPFISLHWVTEITHVQELYYFVDEQRFGPFALWQHQHRFKEVHGGVEMTDEVQYAVPLGILGQLAHWIFVSREVNNIFNHRFTVLEKLFSKEKKETALKTV